MHVFITGATGFIGAALVKELIRHGHDVLGLARSDKSAEALISLGGQAIRGSLDEPSTLKAAAASSEAVIHLAFVHNFDDFSACCATDRAAIQALGDGLKRSGKPLILATGSLAGRMGELADEDTPLNRHHPPLSERALSSDLLLQSAVEKGFRGLIVRLPPSVHGKNDPNFIPQIADLVKKNGSIPVPHMTGRWPAAYLDDVATLFRLVLEKGRDQGVYNASTEVAVRTNDILALLSKKLEIPMEEDATPERVKEVLGFVGVALAMDIPTSSEKTQKELGWKPLGPSLLEDVEANYF